MYKYNLEQEVDWKWLMKFLEAEMEQRMLHYPDQKLGNCKELRQLYMNNLFTFYLSLRGFLRLSLTTKAGNRVEEFIKRGPGDRG